MEIASPKTIYLNGRFLTQAITGVQRTAFELTLALDRLLDGGFISSTEYQFVLIYSGTIVNPIELQHIRLQEKGRLTGNLWEQLELPFYTAGSLLISMCTISCLCKRKQIVFIHDASFIVNSSFFNFTFRTWYKIAITLLGKIALKIITVSNFSKKELIKYLHISEKKIFVIYNSADHILRYPDPAPEFKEMIKALKPYILAVSSQSANKNFNGLSQALKMVDLKDYQLVIAGGTSPTLNRVIADPSVNYLGYVGNDQLKYLYENASLFVFPSFYEGFGIPPLEAMISGCPVISSNTSSLPEVLGNACYYFDPNYLPGIASAINRTIGDEHELSEFKQKGLEQAMRYNWLESAKKLFSQVQSIS